MKIRIRAFTQVVSLVLVVGPLWATEVPNAQVYINELNCRPLGMSETVELYNAGSDSADVSGWTIQGSKGSYVIPSPSLIPPGGYVTFLVGDIQGERGGVTGLIDLVLDEPLLARTSVDEVSYGEDGSAPLPPEGMSLTRAPDGSAGTPPIPDPDFDGLVWSADLAPTFGLENNVPEPQMGSGVVINEIDFSNVGTGDLVELYNPDAVPVYLDGWFLINGDNVQFLNGSIPPGGFQIILTDPTFELEEIGLLYLFQADGTRIDQIGFHDGPDLEEGECFGRCPDGAEPFLGYTYLTSGGGETFFPMPCSLGQSNEPCGVTPPARVTWGRLKRHFD